MSDPIADSLPDIIAARLPDHLMRQRWSGAADRPIDRAELLWHELVLDHEPYLLWTVARAYFADGGEQDYQLFIGARDVNDQPKFLHGKEREIIALAARVDGDGELVLYDALVDPDLAIAVLHLADPDRVVEVRRPIVLEHSNSSVVFDEEVILKVFRKVEPGPNPDVEITRVLAERGYEHVLEPLAELERDGTDLAVLRRFLVGSVEGWTIARTSVRDLLASRVAPGEAGADFAPESGRLGTMLAELHLQLADAWGSEPGDGTAWAADMREQLAEVRPIEGLDVEAVAARFDELAALRDVGAQVHIHGDLHLAQVIQGDTGWVVLDFEGEPARRRAARYTVSSPLRDVAGLLRSLHYAAAVGRAEWGEDGELDLLALGWEQRNREALLRGYFEAEGIDALLPTDPSSRTTVLDAFELDKAVYEVAYELAHRPEQVEIPLAGIQRLLPTPTK